MVKYDLSISNPHMQKDRGFKKYKNSFLRWGTIGFFFEHEGRFEIKYAFVIRKFLKKFFKKKATRRRRVWETPKLLWFVLFPNFILTKKSKNSRMGKGKGLLTRWTIRVRGGLTLFEFKGYNYNKINFFKNQIQKRLPIKIACVYKNIIYYSTYKQAARLLIAKKFSM